jgi:hypothetical protein
MENVDSETYLEVDRNVISSEQYNSIEEVISGAKENEIISIEENEIDEKENCSNYKEALNMIEKVKKFVEIEGKQELWNMLNEVKSKIENEINK